MNGYKIVLLKAIFMLYRLPECERVCSGICRTNSQNLQRGLPNAYEGMAEGKGQRLEAEEILFFAL